MTISSSPKRVLFVCVENANRSQMAQAFARIHGGSPIEAHSAGSRPSGQINPKATEAMRELGYDLKTHGSKSLADIPDVEYDVVVTMGCGTPVPSCEPSGARIGTFQTRKSFRRSGFGRYET